MQSVHVYHVFAPLIFIPRFNSINFYQNRPKIKLFLLKKFKILERWGLRPRPHATGGCGLRPKTPESAPIHCRYQATRLRQGIIVDDIER